MNINGHCFYTFVAYEDVLSFFILVDGTFILKLFEVFFKLVFDHGERSPNMLIMRELPIIWSKFQFGYTFVFGLF